MQGEGRTYVSDRVDVDVVFGTIGVGNEGFDKEMGQNALNSFDLLGLAGASLDPGTSFWPGLVQG